MRRHDTTKRTRGLAAAAVTALLTTGLLAGSAAAEPSEADLEAAYHELSAMNEKVNAVSEDLESTQGEIDDLSAEIAKQEKEFDRRRDVVGQSVVQQQMDSPLGATVSLLGSEDPEAFLDGLGATIALDTQRAQELQGFVDTARALDNRRTALQEREADLAADRKELRSTQAELKSRHDELESQIDALDEEAAAEVTGADTAVEMSADPGEVSGRAGDAIAFAQAQLGDSYVFGGTGPDAWDCSGLTQGAWAAAGVSIPRVAGDQYAAGRDVPLSAVQPGDLVFYGDMSHTGIYIGNGQVIHAANPRRPVEVTSLSYGFTKAARVG